MTTSSPTPTAYAASGILNAWARRDQQALDRLLARSASRRRPRGRLTEEEAERRELLQGIAQAMIRDSLAAPGTGHNAEGVYLDLLRHLAGPASGHDRAGATLPACRR